jgi:hypothetical protein
MWGVAVLGLAKANEGASASTNAMEISSLINNLLPPFYIRRADD